MSTTVLPDRADAPTGDRRLLTAGPARALPLLTRAELLALVRDCGLTGRGGAGFPTAVKVEAVASAGRRPVVVGNAMEGEPVSRKDAVLLHRSPHLVVEGLAIVAQALGAARSVLAVGPEVPVAEVRRAAAALRRPRPEVMRLEGGFVAGQESALVSQLDGGAPVPRDPLVRVSTRGVSGRPTLVLNAETLAQVAMAARWGARWFRGVGLPEDPGTSLVTLAGAVARPGVVEVPRGTPVGEVLARGGGDDAPAVLVGGFHGAWLPRTAYDARLTRDDLAPWGATVGAGVLFALGRDQCPLGVAAGIADYLAGESAGQCGPCLNGLPRIADTLHRLAEGGARAGATAEVARLARLVTGRGACAHPDGTARFVTSTLRVFAPHVEAHLAGYCPIRGAR